MRVLLVFWAQEESHAKPLIAGWTWFLPVQGWRGTNQARRRVSGTNPREYGPQGCSENRIGKRCFVRSVFL